MNLIQVRNPFESAAFKCLRDKWYKKVADSGFVDIEHPRTQELKTYNRRNQTFDNRDAVRDFFIRVDSYITNNPTLPTRDLDILKLYAEGVHVKGEDGIMSKLSLGETTCYRTIKKHKRIILGQT